MHGDSLFSRLFSRINTLHGNYSSVVVESKQTMQQPVNRMTLPKNLSNEGGVPSKEKYGRNEKVSGELHCSWPPRSTETRAFFGEVAHQFDG